MLRGRSGIVSPMSQVNMQDKPHLRGAGSGAGVRGVDGTPRASLNARNSSRKLSSLSSSAGSGSVASALLVPNTSRSRISIRNKHAPVPQRGRPRDRRSSKSSKGSRRGSRSPSRSRSRSRSPVARDASIRASLVSASSSGSLMSAASRSGRSRAGRTMSRDSDGSRSQSRSRSRSPSRPTGALARSRSGSSHSRASSVRSLNSSHRSIRGVDTTAHSEPRSILRSPGSGVGLGSSRSIHHGAVVAFADEGETKRAPPLTPGELAARKVGLYSTSGKASRRVLVQPTADDPEDEEVVEARRKRRAERKKRTKRATNPIAKLCRSLAIRVRTLDVKLDDKGRKAVRYLQLSNSEVQVIRRKYEWIDAGGSGSITQGEFCESLGIYDGPLFDALFTMITGPKNKPRFKGDKRQDIFHHDSISFSTYLVAVTTFCMFSRRDIIRFCFNAFDVDGSGNLDEQEFLKLAKAVQGGAGATFPGNFKRALEEFDINGDGLIDIDEFEELNRRYPLVLFPAFSLQDALQKAIFGLKFWRQLMADKVLARQVREYKELHGGRPPPMPTSYRLQRMFTKRPNPYVDTDALLWPAPIEKPAEGRTIHAHSRPAMVFGRAGDSASRRTFDSLEALS